MKEEAEHNFFHGKRDISTFDTVLFHSNLRSIRRKYLKDFPTDKIALSCWPKTSKRSFKNNATGR